MTPPPQVLSRPVRLTRVCWLVAVVVMTVFVAVAIGLGAATTGDARFRLADQIAMVVLGALVAAVVLGFTRPRVVADAHGIRIRNVVGEKALPWQVVRGVRMEPGAPWATLDLHDDETVALLAVQSNDGDRAVEVVLGLRALLQASRGDGRT